MIVWSLPLPWPTFCVTCLYFHFWIHTCGSGCVTAFLRQTVGPNASYFCTDINPAAARVARKTLVLHDALQHSDVILTDLQSAIASRLKNSVDVLLFNPPYVPTPDEEVHKGGIYASWAGGVDGRVVTDRLLPLVSDLLSPKGIFYLIALEENKPKDIAKIMARYGFQGAVRLVVPLIRKYESHSKRVFSPFYLYH